MLLGGQEVDQEVDSLVALNAEQQEKLKVCLHIYLHECSLLMHQPCNVFCDMLSGVGRRAEQQPRMVAGK